LWINEEATVNKFEMTDDDLLTMIGMWKDQPSPRSDVKFRLLTKVCDELKRRGYIQKGYLEFTLPDKEEEDDEDSAS
jgi:hypothetical protein